ncbi:diguanylate cyclase [Moritella sp. 28]|uniref:diguanylate cyclase n=1 Tax=Moritella sp. 28 TaxID=2746232 RepID=UPI001BA48620|nr:diguanylate cyclase [Moritella sp. 28]QUM84309.1 diguanylate cyclase [Moritella sp. 28]
MPNFSAYSHRLPIQNKLIALSVLIFSVLIAFLLFFYDSFSTSLENEKKAQSKHLTESAIGVISYFHGLSLAGQLSDEDAKNYAMNSLKNSTYGDHGYFWISSLDGEILLQPYKPELVGMSLLDWQYTDGTHPFRDVSRERRKTGGWITYLWSKNDSLEQFSKIAYVSYFAPWDWLIGTGIYLDDMEENVFWTVSKATGILLFGFVLFIGVSTLTINYFINILSKQSVRDSLTKLYSKRFLEEVIPGMLENEKRHNRALAAIFLDIDHFKKINDTYGHNCGDQVLQKVARVMMECTRTGDYCIRYGGEEFVIIGPCDNSKNVIAVAERIRKQVSNLVFTHDGTAFNVTLSAGIALHDHAKSSFDETLNDADMKLFEAKTAGRNCVVI